MNSPAPQAAAGPVTRTRAIDPLLAGFAEEVGSDGPVAVVGSNTRPLAGGRLDPSARLLAAPSGVVEHRPEEMTVRVRAGTAVADLHAVLAEAGQRTALPERGGTVGGAVAVGENHLDVLGRGRVRDCVLEVRYVSADQRLVTGGGPVVKNVSGFNLPKLLTGSLGTLGLLAEVVLRTNPIPEASLWLRATDADPLRIRDALLRPSAVLSDGTTTWVHLEGHEADVASEADKLGCLGDFAETKGPPELPPHRWSLSPAEAAERTGWTPTAPDRPARSGTPMPPEPQRIGGTATAAVAAAPRVAATATRAAPDAPRNATAARPDARPNKARTKASRETGGTEAAGRVVALIGVGTLFAQAPQPPRPLDAGARAVAERMKALFDPSGRLNPGRMPGT